MATKKNARTQYDLPTAVTFLVAGLAVGWLLTALFSPSAENSSHYQSVSQRLARLNEVLYE
jgi:uncharacterized membrane protein YciS (DUF1049 family)